MDFLFLNHSASVEAVIVFLSLSIIFLFLLYDAFLWMRQKYRELYPRKAYLESTPLESKEEIKNIYDIATETQVNAVPEISVEPVVNSPILEPLEVIPSSEPTIDIGMTNLTWDWESEQADIKMDKNPEEEAIVEEKEKVWKDGNWNSASLEPTSTREVWVDWSIEKWESIEKTSDSLWEKSDNWDQLSEEKPNTTDKNMVLTPEKIEEKIESKKLHKESKKKVLSPQKKEKVIEIVNNVKTLIARWHIEDARTLIVNGLSLEKNNRDLNLLMANLYERDHAFEKAEFILKELAEADSDDVEVLNHLATVVAMQRKFEVSYELYKKILSLTGETEDVLYTLTHIAAELNLTEDIYNYSKLYLKQFPKNPEILWLYSQAQITKADRKWAIETLIKLKNLTPYNQEIVDLISKLVTEDELAGNFWEEIK